jgi:hypothetical protein
MRDVPLVFHLFARTGVVTSHRLYYAYVSAPRDAFMQKMKVVISGTRWLASIRPTKVN